MGRLFPAEKEDLALVFLRSLRIHVKGIIVEDDAMIRGICISFPERGIHRQSPAEDPLHRGFGIYVDEDADIGFREYERDEPVTGFYEAFGEVGDRHIVPDEHDVVVLLPVLPLESQRMDDVEDVECGGENHRDLPPLKEIFVR